MTIRQELGRKEQRLFLVAFFFWLGFAGSMVGMFFCPYVAALLALCGVGFATCIMKIFRLRCPRCRGSIGYLFHTWSLPGWSRRIKFCPYCGLDLDSWLEDLPADTPERDGGTSAGGRFGADKRAGDEQSGPSAKGSQ